MSKKQKKLTDNREPYLLRGNRSLVRENSSEKSNCGRTLDTYTNMGEHDTEPGSDHVTSKEFADLSKTIIDKLDGVCANIQSITKDITNIHSALADLEAATKDTSARLRKLEDETLPTWRKERKEAEMKLKESMLALEIHDRKQNLLFYGIEKDKGENVVRKVKECVQKLGFSEEQTREILLVNAHRLPRRPVPEMSGEGGEQRKRGPDPIIARFVTQIDRDAVFEAFQRQRYQQVKNAMEGRQVQRIPFNIMSDLPPELKKRRYELEQNAYKLRKTQNKSTRIKLVGVRLQLECREKNTTSAWKVIEK